ncbi:secretin [Shewanella sp. WE21]|jgi:type III secretion protein C|uniref:secretin N-terminal domain-containing protein n=1 Tax=Shewanella sp. WE21 TaxID=2029986 RepID=UPI000CF67A1D|nr:secretin N-terminal domain-containing protein [Shewanella sp. WE21]AVI67744.1 secretin [Shewanella sp. WE21]
MKFSLLVIVCLFTAFTCQAKVFIKQSDIDLKGALTAIAKDMQIKLVDEVEEQIAKQPITQDIAGDGLDLLAQLSDVYDFDWYVYGGTLTVHSGQDYINHAFKPKNISALNLLEELRKTFTTHHTTKMELVGGGNSIFISGTRKFVNDVVIYANMIDKNQFLENGNNLELVRIEFHYLSVVDRQIDSFDGNINFPGAQSLISSAIEKIGQFENISDGEMVKRAYKVKLNQNDKQQLDEDEFTSKVQVLPGSNALLVRGTPEEIQLAKRIATLIDIQRQQLLFFLRVYDVSVERTEALGVNSSWLNGSRGLYDIIVPPFTDTVDFFKNFQALYSNNMARGVYETNLLVLENQQGHFGKKETATIVLISDKQASTQKIEAENSLYVTGRLLPSGKVQAQFKYIEEALDEDNDESSTQAGTTQAPRVNSQSLTSEVYIEPGQTVILGGFDNTVTDSVESGVPILSSIPWLGELFKSKKETKRKYKRYVSVSFKVI